MQVAFVLRVNAIKYCVAAVLAGALGAASVSLAATEHTKAEANRKKPLQRCDQMKDQAELDCLQKARERVVEARKKRETSEAARSDKSGQQRK